MLSYRHAFHAGNFADVHKHVILLQILQALRRKDTPFFCLDTHAGAGLYDLRGAPAQQNREFDAGIARLWEREDLPPALDAYRQQVRELNRALTGSGELTWYPGSPWFLRQALRARDRLLVCELHSSEQPLLRDRFRNDPQVAVHAMDGYQALKAFLPPPENRGLVLMDPAYERQDEFRRVTDALQQAHRRWNNGVYALWFPCLEASATQRFLAQLSQLGIRKMLLAELMVYAQARARRMNGSGMLLVNPPWPLAEELGALQDSLAAILAQEQDARARVQWLVSE